MLLNACDGGNIEEALTRSENRKLIGVDGCGGFNR